MNHNPTDPAETIQNILKLLQSSAPPERFWPDFLACCADLCHASVGVLLVLRSEQNRFEPITAWPKDAYPRIPEDIREQYNRVASDALENGYARHEIARRDESKGSHIAAIRVDDPTDAAPASCAVFDIPIKNDASEDDPGEPLLRLAAQLPVCAQWKRLLEHSRSDIVHFAGAIDSISILYGEKKFLAAAMAFCNEIASRYSCTRVSIGWKKQGYIRLCAMSHIEKFEKRMEAVSALESAMEEAMDQDQEIRWPPYDPENSEIIEREHKSFSRRFGSDFMVSLPLRVDDSPVAVLTCERAEAPFSEDQINGLRLICDLSTHRLADLETHDAWFGKRIGRKIEKSVSSLLGIEHTFAKLISVLVAAVLMFILFARWDYKVRADFVLKTDEIAYITAPFESFIEDVFVENGDVVKQDAPLLKLDTTELILKESNAIANIQAYDREAEKNRAENRLAEMSIALARKQQAESELGLIRYQLSRAAPTGPFSGIIVKGERKELLGRPVKKGDILLEEARLQGMYPQISVDETDIQELRKNATGRIAFLSRPADRFPVHVDRIDPSAKAEKEGNIFLVKATPLKRADWWRPGMTGIAEIDVGRRSLLWIITHRTIDFFRLHFWW